MWVCLGEGAAVRAGGGAVTETLMVVSVAFALAAGVLWAIDLWCRRKDARAEVRRRVVRTVLDD